MRIRFFALVCTIAAGSLACPTSPQDGIVLTRGMDSLALQDLSEEQVSLLRATLEIDGLPGGESALGIDKTDSGGLAVSGHFELSIEKKTEAEMVLRLYGRLHAEADEVLLARLEQSLIIEPHQANSPAEAGVWQSDGEPIFDLNRNGLSNLQDLKADIEPALPAPYFSAAPSTLEFFSGIRLGDFERRIVLVQNTSADRLEISARLFDAPGVLLTRFDRSGDTVARAARRDLSGEDKLLLPPYSEAFVGVSFAPMNAYLTTGVIQLVASNTRTHVSQALQVKILANTGGDLQPVDPSYRPTPPDLLQGLDWVDSERLFAMPASILFSGQSVSSSDLSGLESGLGALGQVLSWGEGEQAQSIAADAAFVVELPPRHRFAATLSKLQGDVDLALFALDADNQPRADVSPQLSAHAGESPEAVELRNDGDRVQRALLVLGRHETAQPSFNPRALNDAGSGLPFSLSAHLISGPEFDEIEPVLPTQGRLEGGVQVVLRGRGFMAGDGEVPALHVTFADNLALDVEVDPSGTWIHCTLPPGSLEVGKNPATIVVVNASPANGGDGQAATLPEFFTYFPPAPVISELSPAIGPAAGGTLVAIRGGFFSSRYGGPVVVWGGQRFEASSFLSSTPSEIVLPSPPHAAGLVNVAVFNKLGSEDDNEISGGSAVFTYRAATAPPPQLLDLAPAEGSVDGAELVDLTGLDFQPGAQVFFGNTSSVVTYIDPTHLRARTPSHDPGRVDVVVANPDGQQSRLPDAFEYIVPEPSITGVLPDRVLVGASGTVVVYGSGFRGSVTAWLSVSGSSQHIEATNVARVSSEQLLVSLPAVDVEGGYVLTVRNGDTGLGANLEASFGNFLVLASSGPAPVIDSIVPSSGPLDVPTAVVLGGQNFQVGATVIVGAQAAQAVTVASDGQSIEFTTPPAPSAGAVTVRVVNADGQSDDATFTYLGRRPSIYALSPERGPITGGTFVAVSGVNFDVDGVKLLLAGQELSRVSTTSTRIEFVTPPASQPGTVSLQLINPDGQSAQAQFTYYEPQAFSPRIDRIDPDRVALSGGVPIGLSGEHFDVSPPPAVRVGSILVDAAQVQSSASGTRVSFPAPPASFAGSVVVRVINADGQEDSTQLTYFEPVGAMPQIDQVSPARFACAAGADVVLSGLNFGGTTVRVNGQAVNPPAVISTGGRQASFVMPLIADAGTVVVQVHDSQDQAASVAIECYRRRVDTISPSVLNADSASAPLEHLLLVGADLDTPEVSGVTLIDRDTVVYAASVVGAGAGWMDVEINDPLPAFDAGGTPTALRVGLDYVDGDRVVTDREVEVVSPRDLQFAALDTPTAYAAWEFSITGRHLNPAHLSAVVLRYLGGGSPDVQAIIRSRTDSSILAVAPTSMPTGTHRVLLRYSSGAEYPAGLVTPTGAVATQIEPARVLADHDLAGQVFRICGPGMPGLFAAELGLSARIGTGSQALTLASLSLLGDCVEGSANSGSLAEGSHDVALSGPNIGSMQLSNLRVDTIVPSLLRVDPQPLNSDAPAIVSGADFDLLRDAGFEFVLVPAAGGSASMQHHSTTWLGDRAAIFSLDGTASGDYDLTVCAGAQCLAGVVMQIHVEQGGGGPGPGGYDCQTGVPCDGGYVCQGGPMGSLCVPDGLSLCEPNVEGALACRDNSCRAGKPRAADSSMAQAFCDPSAALCSAAEESVLNCPAPQVCARGPAGNPFCADECDDQRPCSPDKTCVGMPGRAICVGPADPLRVCDARDPSPPTCGGGTECVVRNGGTPSCEAGDGCDPMAQTGCGAGQFCMGLGSIAVCMPYSVSSCQGATYNGLSGSDRCWPQTDCSLTGSDGLVCAFGKRCQAGACVDVGTLQLLDTGPVFPMTLGSTELRTFTLQLSNSTSGSASLNVSDVQLLPGAQSLEGNFRLQSGWSPQTVTAGSSTLVHLQAQAGVSSIDDYLLIVDSDDPSYPRMGYLLSASVAGGGPGGFCDLGQPINIEPIKIALHAEGMPQTLTVTGSGFCPDDSVSLSTTAASVSQVMVLSPTRIELTVTADCSLANQPLDLIIERADRSGSAQASLFVKPARIIISEVVLNPTNDYSCEAPPLGWGMGGTCAAAGPDDAYVTIGNPSACPQVLAGTGERLLYMHIVEPSGAVSGSPESISVPQAWSVNSDFGAGCGFGNFAPGCTAAISGFASTATLSPLTRFELYEADGQGGYDLLDAVGLGSGAVPDGSQLFGLDAVRRELKGSLDDPPVWRRDNGNALAMLSVGPPPAAWVSDVLVSSGVAGGDLAGGVDASGGPGVVYLPAASGSPYFVDGSLSPVQVSSQTARDLDLATYYQVGVTAWTITWQSTTGEVFLSDGVGGTSWNTAASLGIVSGRALPRVALKPASNEALVAYASGTELHLWSNLWDPARGLTGSVFVNTSPVALDVCYSPTNDEAHVVWGGNDGLTASTYRTVVVASAGTPSVGSPATILNVDPVELRAAIDASRTLWVAARDSSSQLTVLRMDTVPSTQTWPFYDVGLFDIEVDSLGTPVLVYQDTVNGGLWLMRYNGSVGSWDMPEKIVPDVSYSSDVDLVLDSMDRPHIFWDQGFPESLMHTHQ